MTAESQQAMRYSLGERDDVDYKADKVGLWPGVAAIYMEQLADVFCNDCALDILGPELFDDVRIENLGYDHARADELGNVAAVLSTEEWDCPGAHCGHCGITLDVRVAHYDEVCRPEWCELDID
ncbi:MAG: hypothetical protein R6T93_13960 [Trueperaceae bacterium]